jgi:molybdate/tungstate transport system permease protein
VRRAIHALARPAGYARTAALPLFALIFALFVGLPLIVLLVRVPWSQTTTILGTNIVFSAVSISLESTTIATAITFVFGVPLGFLLARYRFPGKSIITGMVYFPLVLPPIVAGILLILVWGQSGTIEQFLQPRGLMFVNELSGIILCQIFVSSPFIVIASRSAFERIEADLEEAARTMGADTMRFFWSIALPLSMRSILAGVSLSWMRSLGEFGATSIIAYHPFSIPTFISNEDGIIPFSQLLALPLLTVILGALALLVAAALERVGIIKVVIERLTSTSGKPA